MTTLHRAAWPRTVVRDTGGLLLAFAAALVVEGAVVLGLHGHELAGTWELWPVAFVGLVAHAASVPLAIALAALARLEALGGTPRARVVAGLAGLLAGGFAASISTGRHFASLPIRVGFVGVIAATGAAVALAATRVLPRTSVGTRVVLGVVGAAVAWLVDGYVLVRLYPGFHAALTGIAVVSIALAWGASTLRARSAASIAGLALGFLALAAAPSAAKVLARSDNVRAALLDHAPWLGRGVLVAARIAPPPALDDEPAGGEPSSVAAGTTRALDWSGRDIVLVTIDALRADHVGAYGYPRATTPNIDALAARGVRFDHAYCPTPHTSYSVTSLMTGKYMRPLLAIGADDDHETWASQLRRYGYRTAAFYPPAVFFIDEHKFERLRDQGLGFEYRKVEFAPPALRRAQVERYLTASEASGRPLFLWVHAFEPHEPYVAHPEYPFTGDERFDAYDSEIRAADALVGDIVRLVEARRPGAVVIVSADHGEEFGDHGGRYHGTTVYEEQVRVPLVVAAPGLAPRVVGAPVQTIDLLPTVLSALDIPRPARLRGKDLGALATGHAVPDDEGLAFAETDDFTLLARGPDRLVCARKIGACTLYDIRKDPAQKKPVEDRPARVAELKKDAARLARENGRVEASTMPAALRRCMQGDRDAAEEVATLFDDARVDVRRAAARCAFALRAPEMAPQLRRARGAGEEDAEVRAWATLALTRTAGDSEAADLDAVAGHLSATGPERRAAALVLGEHGDRRGEAGLVAWWTDAFGPAAGSPGDLDEARGILAALRRLDSQAAVPALVASLPDVRLRVHVVETLGEIKDARARAPLTKLFVEERYVHVRVAEARALAALGEDGELFRSGLTHFAGVPEPFATAFEIARDRKGLLLGKAGAVGSMATLEATLQAGDDGTSAAGARLWIAATGASPSVEVDGARVASASLGGNVHLVELPAAGPRAHVHVKVSGDGVVEAVWLVRRRDELPAPPPAAWDAGEGSASDP